MYRQCLDLLPGDVIVSRGRQLTVRAIEVGSNMNVRVYCCGALRPVTLVLHVGDLVECQAEVAA